MVLLKWLEAPMIAAGLRFEGGYQRSLVSHCCRLQLEFGSILLRAVPANRRRHSALPRKVGDTRRVNAGSSNADRRSGSKAQDARVSDGADNLSLQLSCYRKDL